MIGSIWRDHGDGGRYVIKNCMGSIWAMHITSKGVKQFANAVSLAVSMTKVSGTPAVVTEIYDAFRDGFLSGKEGDEISLACTFLFSGTVFYDDCKIEGVVCDVVFPDKKSIHILSADGAYVFAAPEITNIDRLRRAAS